MPSSLKSSRVRAAVLLATIGVSSIVPVFWHRPPMQALAQAEGDATPQAGPSEPPQSAPKPTKLKKSHGRRAEAAPAEAKPGGSKPVGPPVKAADAPPTPQAPPTLAAAAASGAEKSNFDIAAKLTQAGAGACSATIDAEAAASMIGVTQSNIVTTWSNVEPRNKHAVNVFVGQRYGDNRAVPFGVTGLIASPNASGTCDTTVVQVVTSPLPCTSVRDTLLRAGRMEGDLAGVLLIHSGQDRTLLMSTATNSCVLIGFRSVFRN